ncbi:MAG: phosphoribosylformylglycinamidine synthase subunit PurS [Rickettsiales bacterium]|nr:phosphoribosylformylglycinamidine synthase subunit PurS [Rickettsiales bacterium]
MKAKIYVTLKHGVLDPQGAAISTSLKQKGIEKIDQIRQGKYFEVEFDTNDLEEAKKLADKICNDLLVNTVLEDYEIKLEA